MGGAEGTTGRVGKVVRRYAVPVVGVGVVLGVRLVLDYWVKLEAPFLMFLMAVVASALYGGLGPGVVAVGLAAGVTAFFFVEPVRRFAVGSPSEWMQLGLFVLEGLVACALCASLRAARERAEAEAERSRRLEGAVLTISDAEQRRIGQDLHDGLGQHLTGVAFLAKALEKRVAITGPGAAGDAGRVAQLVNEAIGRARDVARGLSPVDLESEGLGPALRHLVTSAGSMFGIDAKLGWGPGIGVADPAVAMHLYRIAQEAINNAVRHGKAGRVEVTVTRVDGAAEAALTVTDNGVGIGEGAGVGGMGLQIMAYRARMIGGRLEVGRGKRGGTVVRCAFPVAGGVAQSS